MNITARGAIESAERVIRRTLREHVPTALACSFGGPSGMVLLDMTMRVDPHVPVFYLDTGLLFDDVRALIERARERYGIDPIAVKPSLSLDEQAERYGAALWERDPDRCCTLRKVEPHRAFVRGYAAWLTGIRRAQSPLRRSLAPMSVDDDGITKVSPLFSWTDDDIEHYVAAYDVPLNALHAEGYPSVGCVPCTRAVALGEDPRAGRWAGFEKTECGLHSRTAEAR